MLFILSFTPLLIFALTALLNAFTFPRLRRQLPITNLQPPLLSILIPMRNESAVIAQTVDFLLKQDYPNLEILLLDDNSEDDSAGAALRASGGDPRLSVIPGLPLPPGWLGKNWACQQLSERARGEYLLFTDADVRWQPGAISALMAEAGRTRADLLTAWPTQITVTWGERLVVPLMGFAILAYLPVLAVHYLPWPIFAAAMGQCLLFRRLAYQKVGGHAALRGQVLDDMRFAYAIKHHGLRLRAVEANDLIQTRMYHTWLQVRDGFAKNILAGHGNSLLFLLFSTFFHGWLFILPWLLLLSSLLTHHPASPLAHYYLPITLGLAARALTAIFTRQRARDALLMPVSVFLMTLIAIRAIYWHFSGGPRWKGRVLRSTQTGI